MGDKIDGLQAINWITQHFTLDRTPIERAKAIRGQLLLQERVILCFVCKYRDI